MCFKKIVLRFLALIPMFHYVDEFDYVDFDLHVLLILIYVFGFCLNVRTRQTFLDDSFRNSYIFKTVD